MSENNMGEQRSVIFLDIDGVLNGPDNRNKSYEGFPGVEDQYLNRLNVIYECTGADIVLVTDWKDEWNKAPEMCKPDGKYLNDRFKEHEMVIIDKTDDRSRGDDERSGRGLGIKKYLESHPVKAYVILDDIVFSDYDKALKDHLIEIGNGLTEEDVEKAISLMIWQEEDKPIAEFWEKKQYCDEKRCYSADFSYDEEAGVWIVESDDITGLVLESESLDTLINRVREAVPEILDLNGLKPAKEIRCRICDRIIKEDKIKDT